MAWASWEGSAMRVTFNTFNLKNLDNLNKSLNKLSEANEQVTKGRTLLAPEDDPVRYAKAMSQQNMLDESDQFKRNAENSLIWLDNETNELTSAYDIVNKAKNEHALAGLNLSLNSDNRKILSQEIDSLISSLINNGNAKYMGKYIFAGMETETQPFQEGGQEIKLISSSAPGYELINKNVFSDINELESGYYDLSVVKENDTLHISLKNDNGKSVNVDSGGTDESGSAGNVVTNVLSTEYIAEEVVDTGLGVAIKLPEEVVSTDIRFYYAAGDGVSYKGDDSLIKDDIGYRNELTLNIPGREAFMDTFKSYKSPGVSTVNGVAIDGASILTDLDNVNISSGDSIEFSGLDHSGLVIGSAKATSKKIVDLNFTGLPEKQREITISYANHEYNLLARDAPYIDITGLVADLNTQLDEIGLGSELAVRNDGDRLLFATLRGGNTVKFAINGSDNNKLGFNKTPVVATGKNTVFDIGDFNDPENIILDPLEINFKMDFDSNKKTLLTINGNTFEIRPDLDNDGKINPKEIDTAIQKEMDKINPSLKHICNVTVEDGKGGDYNVNIQLSNINYDDQTYLSASFKDSRGHDDHAVEFAEKGSYPVNKDVRAKDLTDFISNLFNDEVDASFNNGKLIVKDKRAGNSELLLKINENNEGIERYVNKDIRILGSYSGVVDNVYDIEVNNKKLTVTDQGGFKVIDRMDLRDYRGETIDLNNGLSVVLQDTGDTSVKINVREGGKLDFGDLILTEDGASNVDTFRSLKNLSDAMKFNIPRGGIGEPSAWKDEEFQSSNPFFDGKFRGNYNDLWKFEIAGDQDKNTFFLQNELKYTVTGVVNEEMINSGDKLDFDIVVQSSKYNDPEVINIDDEFTSVQELLDKINDELAGYKSYAVYDDHRIKVVSPGNNQISLYGREKDTSEILGFTDAEGDNLKITVLASGAPSLLNLSETGEIERTLNIKIYDDDVWTENKVTVQAKDYGSVEKIADELNSSDLLPKELEAKIVDGRLTFTHDGPVKGMIIEAEDYNNKLGFLKAGDVLKIKVSDANNKLVNYAKLDTAGESVHIKDGVALGFDSGELHLNNNFTTTVGSGIDYEMDVLAKAEKQLLKQLTIVGTRQNVVDSSVNFHSLINEANQGFKTNSLGSGQNDMVRAITDLNQAQQAYQAGLSAAVQSNQLSILDFLG